MLYSLLYFLTWGNLCKHDGRYSQPYIAFSLSEFNYFLTYCMCRYIALRGDPGVQSFSSFRQHNRGKLKHHYLSSDCIKALSYCPLCKYSVGTFASSFDFMCCIISSALQQPLSKCKFKMKRYILYLRIYAAHLQQVSPFFLLLHYYYWH